MGYEWEIYWFRNKIKDEVMEDITHIDDIEFGAFSPIDKETSIIEVLRNDDVLIDFSFAGDSPSGEIEILFHDNISGKKIPIDLFEKIIATGVEKLRNSI